MAATAILSTSLSNNKSLLVTPRIFADLVAVITFSRATTITTAVIAPTNPNCLVNRTKAASSTTSNTARTLIKKNRYSGYALVTGSYAVGIKASGIKVRLIANIGQLGKYKSVNKTDINSRPITNSRKYSGRNSAATLRSILANKLIISRC